MENNNREQDIKRMFDQHQPELNTNEIWEAIEPKLKKKKKRRFLLFWLLGGGLVLLSSLFYYNTGSNSSSEWLGIKVGETPIENQNKATPNKEEKELFVAADQEETLSNNTEQEEYQSALLATAKSPQPSSTKTSKNRTTINTISEKTNQETLPQIEKIINSKSTLQTTSESETINAIIPLQSQNVEFKEPVENTIVDPKTTEKEDQELLAKEVLEEEVLPLLEKEQNEEEEKARAKKNRKKIKPHRRSKWEVQLQTALSPVLAYKNLKENPDRDRSVPAYIAKRKESEKQLEAFAYNVGLHFQHKRSGLTLMSAIEYRQFNERFGFSSTEVTTSIETGTVTVTENIAGDIINSSTGPKTITTTVTEEQKLYNQHRFISIPFGIGRIWLNKRNAWKVMGGFEYNILYSFNGTFYTNLENRTDFNQDQDRAYYNSIFKSSTGLNAWLSGEYSRSINPRLSWLIAPKLQVPLSSTTQADFQVKQNFFALQFDLGINYLLNPKKKTKREEPGKRRK